VRTYSLVGRRCFAEPDTETPSPAIVDQLRRLAAAVGVQVMTAQFVRHDRELCFVAATTTVDVSIPAVADAILEIVDPPS
jgi:prephenate dehydrogenase